MNNIQFYVINMHSTLDKLHYIYIIIKNIRYKMLKFPERVKRGVKNALFDICIFTRVWQCTYSTERGDEYESKRLWT